MTSGARRTHGAPGAASAPGSGAAPAPGSAPAPTAVDETAPAKVNLVLHVGPVAANGLHEVCSLFASIDPADTVRVEARPAGEDSVVCPAVPGPNLAEAALEAFRTAAPDAALPPLQVTIDKRIPIAAGLGGGSADAAATLRAANRLAGDPLTPAELRDVAATLGSDVPSQVEPGHALVTGTGEIVEPVELPPAALVLVPAAPGLAAGDVYAEADRLDVPRDSLDPDRLRALAKTPLPDLAGAAENDLERAVLSLRPELETTLAALREQDALAALVSGSGPSAFGLFADADAAATAADALPGAFPASLRRTPA